MRHKFPIFLFACAIICFIGGFFKSHPIVGALMQYPVFTIVLLLLGLFCAGICVVIFAIWMGELISRQRRFHGVAYQPMPEENCDGHCAPGECICEDKAANPELYDEIDVKAYAEDVAPFVAPDLYNTGAIGGSIDVHAGEESVHEEEELPKEGFEGFVEAPVAPTPPPVAPHEDQNHPNYDPAAGRIIYK